MTDLDTFPSATPCHGLPLLFSGQSQKEMTVNEALLLADFLLHPWVKGAETSPPASPAPGDCWIVAAEGTSEFSGHDNALAAWTEGGWRFISPRMGMRVFDQANASQLIFDGIWRRADAPAGASGGAVVDVEARAAIDAIINQLVSVGIFSAA